MGNSNAKKAVETLDNEKKLTDQQRSDMASSVAGIIDLPAGGVDKYRAQVLFDAMFGAQYGYTCDECHTAIPKPDPHLHCWECGYDVCKKCEKTAKEHEHDLMSEETEYTEDLRARVVGASCSETMRNVFVLFRNRPCMAWREDGEFQWCTYEDIFLLCVRFGTGLHEFTKTRDFVGILSENRMEYFIYDWTCMLYGFVSVPIHSDFGEEDINHIISETNMTTVLCSPKFLPKLLKAVNIVVPVKLTTVVILTDDETLCAQARASCHFIDFKSFASISKCAGKPQFVATPSNELITVVYTSGSTGHPKGAMFSDKIWRLEIADPKIIKNLPREHVVMSYLPTSHITDRITVALAICGGGRVGISTGDIGDLFRDLPVIKPTYFSAPPVIWIKIYKDYQDVLANAIAQSPEEDKADVKKRVMKEFSKILGGSTQILSTGGAHTPPHIFPFVRECFDCVLGEGYGITEAGGITSDQRVNPDVHIKLLDVPELGYTTLDLPYPRGEICVKRDNMFMGYFNAPEKTNEVLQDGWYRTGDIGMFVKDRLQVIDRAKSVFKLIQGEFISPEKLEKLFHQSTFINQIFITAEPTQFRVVAIIVPRKEAVDRFALQNSIEPNMESICRNEQFIAAVKSNLSEIGNASRLKYYEIPCAIYLEPVPFTAESKKLTPSLKIRRHFLFNFYAPIIRNLYEAVAQSSSRTKIKDMMLDEWKKFEGGEKTSVDPNLASQGLSSLGAVHLSQFLSRNLGIPISPQVLYDEDPSYAIAHLLGEHPVLNSINWESELQLPEFPLPDTSVPLASLSNLGSILLTGATGFLGIFLLFEILEQFPTARVFCIVRGNTTGDLRRLEEIMKESGTWKDEYSQRVEVISGDISLPALGLDEPKFIELSNSIEAIFHCGAAVNSVMSYNVLKKANVGGTIEVLRLALTSRRKYLFHISTLSVLDVHDGNGKLDEIPMKALSKKLNDASGYSQSKFVSDMLVRQAIAKYNVPALVFRPTTISGDTKSGYSNIRDSVNIIMSGIAELGMAPRIVCEFDICPVDSVAKAIVHISKQGDFSSSVYHITNPKDGVSLHQIIQALETSGRIIKKVEFEDWLKAVSTIPNHPLYMLLPNVERGMGGLTYVNPNHSKSAWSKEIGCNVVNEEVLRKYIQWLAPRLRSQK